MSFVFSVGTKEYSVLNCSCSTSLNNFSGLFSKAISSNINQSAFSMSGWPIEIEYFIKSYDVIRQLYPMNSGFLASHMSCMAYSSYLGSRLSIVENPFLVKSSSPIALLKRSTPRKKESILSVIIPAYSIALFTSSRLVVSVKFE